MGTINLVPDPIERVDSSTTILLIAKDITYIQRDLGEYKRLNTEALTEMKKTTKENFDEIKKLLENGTTTFVTKDEFKATIDPIKKLVYGLTLAVLVGMANEVIKRF